MKKQLEKTLDEFQSEFTNTCVNGEIPLSKYQREAFEDLKENLINYLQGMQKNYIEMCKVRDVPLSKHQIDVLDGLVTKLQFSENIKIEDLELTQRSYRALRGDGIEYVSQLVKKGDINLLKIPNLGRKSLREIQEKLDLKGYSLKSKLL